VCQAIRRVIDAQHNQPIDQKSSNQPPQQAKTMKRNSAPSPKPKTIDEYLSAVSADKRAALEELRKSIRAAAPKAEECISYTVQGRMDQLKGYDISKGTIRFQESNPLPTALVRKLVRARIKERV
jgi:uncharacterized protein YdhG (YjbR/CyaY superfamily)